MLSANRNFIRYKTLIPASDAIINKVTKLPIFAKYNLADYGVHASVDGQKIDFDNMKSVYVLSENYFQTLVTKAENIDAQNELEGLNPNQLNFIS